mmetsp:Transcript_38925/g.81426  ORF Transcript_38925/g.81426 Transcript_38925/m.81426 type:complete len:636 (-) Transcript_38925:49-1956(-)
MVLSSTSLPSFESHGGKLEEFDDGHCPETFRFQQHEEKNSKNIGDLAVNCDAATPRIVRYNSPQLTSSASSNSTSPLSVHVYDGVLNPNNSRMLYNVTAPTKHMQQMKNDTLIKLEGESPWGTYVTIKEASEWIEWNKREGESGTHGNFNDYFVAWRQKMIRYYMWQKHERLSSDEKKEEQIETNHEKNSHLQRHLDDMENIRHLLAVEAVAKFFLETIPFQPGTTEVVKAHPGQSSNETLFDTAQILKKAHGVAVWALSSSPGQSVSYHIDYAELLRYEYNVTVPPLWAGTVHCSALWNDRGSSSDNQCNNLLPESHSDQNCMKGGEFCVNLRGLDHYAENGYKGNISGNKLGGWSRPSNATSGQCLKGEIHVNDDDQWVTIPYAFNRGIVHHGEFPHLSAPIQGIGTQDSNSADGDGRGASPQISRVIVGFNVFGHDVGAHIAKAPEHSKPFRRKVRLYRSTINASMTGQTSVGEKSRQGGMDISQIRKNKGLTKLLVLAKREKVKEELRRNQEQLTCRIWRRMLSRPSQDGSLPRVSDIVNEFGSPNDGLDGVWPKSIDVHVHLHHMFLSTESKQDSAQKQEGAISKRFKDPDGFAGLPETWYCVNIIKDKNDSRPGGLIPLSAMLDLVKCK